MPLKLIKLLAIPPVSFKILGNLAMLTHQSLHNPQQALEYYKQAQALCDQIDFPKRKGHFTVCQTNDGKTDLC